ncbi:MAG: hypothetical protein AMJ63_04580 [Myxococcales bacterium SG8_38_1]|nr:MAG: hypothetical protein AMJ63_04580 [Myxococcales bacterium SG8_38_1]
MAWVSSCGERKERNDENRIDRRLDQVVTALYNQAALNRTGIREGTFCQENNNEAELGAGWR